MRFFPVLPNRWFGTILVQISKPSQNRTICPTSLFSYERDGSKSHRRREWHVPAYLLRWLFEPSHHPSRISILVTDASMLETEFFNLANLLRLTGWMNSSFQFTQNCYMIDQKIIPGGGSVSHRMVEIYMYTKTIYRIWFISYQNIS